MTADPHAAHEPERRPTPCAGRTTTEHWTRSTGAQLLVIDPNPDTHGLSRALLHRGIHVTWVHSTLQALVEFGRCDPPAVLVAPACHGIAAAEFIKTIRKYGTSFIIAALDVEDDPQAGTLLLAGANAAVVRPYSADAIWAVLERNERTMDDRARVVFGPIELDARAYTVTIDGDRVRPDLPLKEFEMLRALMYRAPDVLTNEELRTSLWGGPASGPTDNAIAVQIARLRHRLDGVAQIRRIRGRGYSIATI